LRRLIRITPLHWLATTVKLAAMLLVPGVVLHAALDWTYVAKSYLFIPAYALDGTIAPLLAVGWTLLFEMFFYLVFAAALALRANLIAFCGAVMLLCAAGSLLKPNPAPAYMMYLHPIVIEFLIGMAVLVLGVIGLERHVRRFPRALVFLGAASYALYLMHPLISPLAPALLARAGLIWPAASVLACIALALGLTPVVFVLFERGDEPPSRLAAAASRFPALTHIRAGGRLIVRRRGGGAGNSRSGAAPPLSPIRCRAAVHRGRSTMVCRYRW